MRTSLLTSLVLSAVLAACGDTSTTPDPSADGGASTDAGTSPFIPGDGAVVQPSVGEVFASTQGALYKLEPYSKVLSLVGNYDCIELTPDPNDSQDGMADIAVDKNGKMYGVGRPKVGGTWALLQVDKSTAKCSVIADLGDTFPTGLTFVPAGTVDPNEEALVGIFIGGDYTRYDLKTGAKTKIGTIGKDFFSKGADIVSIIGGKTYTTNQGAPDHLLELDTKTGAIVKDVGPTGTSLIAGLGYWAGTLYAFNYEGKLFAVNVDTGASTEIPIPNKPADLKFWGAAVTTAAPTQPPK